MSKMINNYYLALERLVKNKPIIVQFPYKINNDTVAIEAGRKRGAIKQSRPELAELILDIKHAEEKRLTFAVDEQRQKKKHDTDIYEKFSNLAVAYAELKERYDSQLLQLNQLIRENHKLRSLDKDDDNIINFILKNDL